jgi:hypothetical protein
LPESVRLTLDTNCLIDLEHRTGQATAIWQLVKLHRGANIQLFVPQNDRQFEDRLKALGMNDLPSVFPTGRNEMSFWGAAVCGDDRDDLVEKIHKIVHSTVDTLFLNSRSRTALCDAEGLAAHIRSAHDIFVTSDQHFRKATRRQALIALGAKNILTPEEALSSVLQQESAVEKQ